jgi:uncharacterized protein
LKFWRWLVIVALYVVPIAAFSTAGVVAVYRSGRYAWIWWLAPLCWVAAWLLTRLWRKRLAPPGEDDFTAPTYWTARDHEAWHVVEAQQRRIEQIAAEQLTDPHFYLQSSMDLALAVARHYHPKAKDPIGSLTVLDLLAASQLAIEDSALWCRQYVPGSHLLTVDQWRLLGKAPAWFSTAGNVAWAASLLMNPLNFGRFLISKLTTESATRQLREHALGWFYVIFVRHAGFYLIEMNSGRLRGGAARYRQLRPPMPRHPGLASAAGEVSGAATAAGPTSASGEPLEVRIAVVGQVKAGKSSLINALLGSQQAAVDVLPQTRQVQRYELRAPAAEHPASAAAEHSDRVAADRLILLDTAGYADAGATREQLAEMHEALRDADLVLLVMDAASPARRAEAQLLEEFDAWLQANLQRKLPPVLGVLTHVDRLRPTLEWSPPYDWRHPSRPKEYSLAGAVDYTREQFGAQLAAVVPVCTDGDRLRVWGVYDELLPVLLQTLGDARGCALLRTLHAELNRDRVQLLFRQLGQACTGLLRAGLTRLLRDSLLEK